MREVTRTCLGRIARRLGLATVMLAWAAFRQRADFDVILTDGEHVGLPLALLLKCARASTRHVTIGHRLTAPKKRPLFRRLRLHSHIDRIAVHAYRQVELGLNELRLPAEKLALVPYQVDTHFWRSRGRPEEKVICSAGLEFRDYPTLFTAVDGLDVKLIVGAASNFSRRSISARGLEIPPNVRVSSFDYVSLRDLYQRSAIVVVPLDDVDFQAGVTTILEAMAMSRPVIVTETRGQTDVVIDRRSSARNGRRPRPLSLLRLLAAEAGMVAQPNGLYVPPGDSAALRDAITFLLDNPGQREALGAAGRELVERLCTPDHFAERLTRLVDEACAPRRVEAGPARASVFAGALGR
jgi:glycosyltransferase involved in cell wall biosynthesis